MMDMETKKSLSPDVELCSMLGCAWPRSDKKPNTCPDCGAPILRG